MKLHCLIQLMISAIILLGLIFNIRNSRLFNFYDHLLHHKLVKNREGKIWKIITILNEPKVIVVWDFILAGLLVMLGHPWLAIWALGTLAVTDAVGIFLKHSVKRQRPLSMKIYRDGYSFPSGHVLSATIMSLMLWQIFGHTMGIWLLIILIIAWGLVVISRLNMRAHYPSDVLGATSLALFCFTIAQQLLGLAF